MLLICLDTNAQRALVSTQVLSAVPLVLSPPRFVGERVRERGKAAGNRPCCSASNEVPGPRLAPSPYPSPGFAGEKGWG